MNGSRSARRRTGSSCPSTSWTTARKSERRWRGSWPVYAPRGDRQVGKLTSHGWSPILKQAIGLASVSPAYEALGSKLSVEWTVEGQRGRVDATVVPLPFLDLPRKRA
jgi:glycine cleavage system aminomethyltransferase T